jgi:protein-tyrosine kinase
VRQVTAENSSLLALGPMPLLAARIQEEILEACRGASLQLGGPALRTLGVTSAIRGEGRSLIALAMAHIHAQDYGRKVLLVDLDMERPAMSRLLDADQWPGLTEVVRKDAALEDAIQAIEGDLFLLSSGALIDSPVRILADIPTSGLFERIGREFDVVIGDLPPIIATAYGRLAASLFPKLLLVVRAGVTPLSMVREAAQNLASEPAVLVNCEHSNVPHWARRLIGSDR